MLEIRLASSHTTPRCFTTPLSSWHSPSAPEVIDAFPSEYPQNKYFWKGYGRLFANRVPIMKHDKSFAELDSAGDSRNGLQADLKDIDTDLKIQSQDGQNILVFIKKGLHRPLDKERGDLCILGITAMKELLKAYPALPTKDPGDVLTENSTDTSTIAEFGVYHFDLGLQTVQNHHSGTNLAGEVLINHSKFQATMAFFKKMTPVMQSLGALFEIIDPKNYARYKDLYDKIADRSILCAFHTTRRACWQVVTALCNVTNPPDVNLRECVHKDGWVVQTCFGEFTGGALQVPELGIKFEFQPGDVVFMRPALLECTVADFIGERFGLVLYNHKDVQEDQDSQTTENDTAEGEGLDKRKRSEEEDGETRLPSWPVTLG